MMWFADSGVVMLASMQVMQAEAPVVVARVVWPAGHGEHEAMEVAWGKGENFPATQLEHFLVVPSLYLPAMQAEHVVVVQLAGTGVMPLASRAAESPHLMHADAPATLPMPAGQAEHVVLPLKAENVPAVHGVHEAPDALVPGAQAVHAVTLPPAENCSGVGHWTQVPAALLYWLAGQLAASEEVKKRVIMMHGAKCGW